LGEKKIHQKISDQNFLCHIFNTHFVVVVVVVVVGGSFSAVARRSLVWVDWDDCWTRGQNDWNSLLT
jgi:hypothetical protein